ncbi:MAG: LDCC motif putative metal-binding protein [Clostridiaceae bacterium]
MKKFLKDFIKKIADQNSKTFGDGKLDCCDLNKTNNTNNKANDKNK